MSTDPCLDAALASLRPSLWRRIWRWYKRVTGYEPRRFEGPRFQSTYPPGCNCILCNPRRLP